MEYTHNLFLITGYRPIMYACIVTQGELPDETIPASRVPGEGLPMGRIEVCEGTDDFGQYVIWCVTHISSYA